MGSEQHSADHNGLVLTGLVLALAGLLHLTGCVPVCKVNTPSNSPYRAAWVMVAEVWEAATVLKDTVLANAQSKIRQCDRKRSGLGARVCAVESVEYQLAHIWFDKIDPMVKASVSLASSRLKLAALAVTDVDAATARTVAILRGATCTMERFSIKFEKMLPEASRLARQHLRAVGVRCK